MNHLLSRNYFEYDKMFYSQNVRLSCWEQMKYQGLRDYDIDFFLTFCNDINSILFIDDNKEWAIWPNDLNYNEKLCTYINVSNDVETAEKSIKEILDSGKAVVFQTAMDYLHTCAWFHENEPYTRFVHYAIIIGYVEDNFFYVDGPTMRNTKCFRPHHQNPAVGYIDRNELLISFKYHCKIGYFHINRRELSTIAGIRQILNNSHKFLPRQYRRRGCLRKAGIGSVKGIANEGGYRRQYI